MATIQQEPELEATAKARLAAILVQFMVQRFTQLSLKEIETMLKLVPIEETVAGQELIERGVQRALRSSIIDVIQLRFGGAPELVRAVVQRIDDPETLQALHRQAVTADSLAAFERVLAKDYTSQSLA